MHPRPHTECHFVDLIQVLVDEPIGDRPSCRQCEDEPPVIGGRTGWRLCQGVWCRGRRRRRAASVQDRLPAAGRATTPATMSARHAAAISQRGAGRRRSSTTSRSTAGRSGTRSACAWARSAVRRSSSRSRHRSTSFDSAARARELSDLTVPGRQSSARAISASLRSA